MLPEEPRRPDEARTIAEGRRDQCNPLRRGLKGPGAHLLLGGRHEEVPGREDSSPHDDRFGSDDVDQRGEGRAEVHARFAEGLEGMGVAFHRPGVDLGRRKAPLPSPRGVAGAFAIIPGAGHVYCERYQDAFIAFLLNGVMIWATLEAFDNDNEGLGVLLALFEVGLYTGNIYSAVNCAQKHNRKQNEDFLQYLKDHSKVQISAGPMNQGYAMALSYQIAF